MKRIFSPFSYKGLSNYLHTQKRYEVARTILYFALSLSLFIIGYVTTKTRANLLTVVAILGCLPASKSLVEAIMYLKYDSLDADTVAQINEHSSTLWGGFDFAFTSYEKNFQVDHLVIKGNTICGYSSHEKVDENACEKHLDKMLLQDGYKNYTIKIFKDLPKYLNRLDQLKELESDDSRTDALLTMLKSISL